MGQVLQFQRKASAPTGDPFTLTDIHYIEIVLRAQAAKDLGRRDDLLATADRLMRYADEVNEFLPL